MKHHLVDLIQVCSNYTHWANNGPAPGVTCFMLPTGFNLSPNVKSCYTQITSLEKKPPALGKRWLSAAPRPLAPETPRYHKPTLPQSPHKTNVDSTLPKIFVSQKMTTRYFCQQFFYWTSRKTWKYTKQRTINKKGPNMQ